MSVSAAQVGASVDDSLAVVAQAILEQNCILFLGAGVHAPPPDGSPFSYPEEQRPPIGSALSRQLADDCKLAEALLGEALNTNDVEALAYGPAGQDVAAGTGTGAGLWSGFVWGGFPQLRAEVRTLSGGDLTRPEWRQAAPGIPDHEPGR